jgi:hypothetical protein
MQQCLSTLFALMSCGFVSCSEAKYGQLLAPYLADPSNLFIISSDFCHWGSRFKYTYTNSEQVSVLATGHCWFGRPAYIFTCVHCTADSAPVSPLGFGGWQANAYQCHVGHDEADMPHAKGAHAWSCYLNTF